MNECFWSFYKLGHYFQFTQNRIFQVIGMRESQWRTIFSFYVPNIYFWKETTTNNGNGHTVYSINYWNSLKNFRFILFKEKIGTGYNNSDFGDCC